MHQILFRIGGVVIQSYGFMMTVAFASTLVYFYFYGPKAGFTAYEGVEIGTLAYFFSLIMSHLIRMVINFSYYHGRWDRIFFLLKGRSWHGDLLGFLLLVYIYCRIKKYPTGQGMDLVFTGSILALAVGRIGCILGGCCYGTPTNLPWAVLYPSGHPATVPVHPVQIYEMIGDLAIFGFLLWKFDRRRFYGENALLMFCLYSVLRFVVEFFRFNPPNQFYGPFSMGQWASVAILIITGGLLLYFYRKFPSSTAVTAGKP